MLLNENRSAEQHMETLIDQLQYHKEEGIATVSWSDVRGSEEKEDDSPKAGLYNINSVYILLIIIIFLLLLM